MGSVLSISRIAQASYEPFELTSIIGIIVFLSPEFWCILEGVLKVGVLQRRFL